MAEQLRCPRCCELMIGDYDPELGFFHNCQSCGHVDWTESDQELNETCAPLDDAETHNGH
jgi:hypothetical protein